MQGNVTSSSVKISTSVNVIAVDVTSVNGHVVMESYAWTTHEFVEKAYGATIANDETTSNEETTGVTRVGGW